MIVKSTAAVGLMMAGLALAAAGFRPGPQAPNPAPPPGAPTRPAEGRPDGPDAGALSKDHLKQVALACMNVVNASHVPGNDARFPAPAFLGADGQPKLSWRVSLLPYLGEEALFHEFHLTEPWDSPHNRALIARMPDVFRTPDSPAPDGMTRFRGFQGRGTLFEGPAGAATSSITDGAFLTVLFVQAADPTVWTKPGELPADPGRDLPALDGPSWRMAMADGAVLDQPPAGAVLLRALISRNGGEVVPAPPWTPEVFARQTAPTRPAPAGPADRAMPAAPPRDAVEAARPAAPAGIDRRLDEFDGRLQAIEAKLDRLIRTLDGRGEPAPR